MFKNIKLGTKVVAALSVFSAVFLATGIYNNSVVKSLDQSDTALYERNVVPLDLGSDLALDFQRLTGNTRDAMLNTGAEQEKWLKRLSGRKESFLKSLKNVEAILNLDEERMNLVAEMSKDIGNYLKVIDTTKDLAASGKNEQAREFFYNSESITLRDKLTKDFIEFLEVSSVRAKKRSAENTALASEVARNVWIIIGLALLLTAIVSYVLSKNITGIIRGLLGESEKLVGSALAGKLSDRGNIEKINFEFRGVIDGFNKTLDAVLDPINEAAMVLERMSQKDLTAKVHGVYSGDHAIIKNNLNGAVESLASAFSQVTRTVEQVTSASSQISSGSQDLAQGANRQASSIEEISSSLEELTSMVQQNQESTLQANTLASAAQKDALKGSEAMADLGRAMTTIKSSADQMAKIIKTIDEIAFQTNLLALNAAVEAARAGDAGKGFAVVADEVRNLAQRSAEAAKNTQAMIEESQQNVENGVRVNQTVNQILVQIVEGSQKVAALISEVSASTKEQSAGIGQINSAIAELNTVTQANASVSEESASASEELNAQAEQLSQMMGEFSLDGETNKQGLQAGAHNSKAEKKPILMASVVKKSELKKESSGPVKKTGAAIPLTPEELKNY